MLYRGTDPLFAFYIYSGMGFYNFMDQKLDHELIISNDTRLDVMRTQCTYTPPGSILLQEYYTKQRQVTINSRTAS